MKTPTELHHKLFLEICQIPYLRSRGEISHTQNTCEATGGSERFSAMIVFIVPAMVFLPSSRLSRRPDFSTKKTATVNATHTKKNNRLRSFTTCTCTTTCISIYTRSQLQIISFIAGQGLTKIGFKIFLWVRRPHSLRVQGRFLLAYNNLSPNINIQILLTDLSTFPFRTSWKNLIKDQKFFSL